MFELLAERGLTAGARVLEIGSGTGQATGELLARGADVVAVEPGPGMAELLTARLGGDRLRVVCADFEDAQLPDAPFDLATSATAFHWVRPDVALPKLARALRPGGWLAVWWTVFGDPENPTPFRWDLPALYDRYLPHERRDPTFVPGPLRVDSWTDELRQGGWFGPVEVELIRWEHRLTAAGARRLFGSFPNVNGLPAARREAFLDELGALVDERGGEVADPYVTAVYLTRPTR
ncbi:class I SAM-dependent methyltransferase [Luedemannella flava]|uniref:Class I SAM-dependent methyltransferase n=1 Tax=Luedemannella flava TaxID=349316 RepID=A0ABN2MMK4_9ACTN